MSKNHSTEETILEEALTFASAEARLAYLQGACGGDEQLRARVQSLIDAHEAAGGFLGDITTAGVPTVRLDHQLDERPGSVIGRYKLLQQIGEGGCGVVYMAEQEEPVRRRVALKVIKLGMDTKQVVARFEAERQALALMDHPNIAKVLDAGATEAGRPYFVMELVRGIKITEYCDQNKLPTQERLNLFVQVCHAIQHAHQKGIIHRDIKPSNVLVSLHDGVPVPVVIDFGIAKAIEQRLTDKTLFTAFEQFVGTPAYTSPEQAEMSRLDIDTRSDIYSLGVLLYELLTCMTPFDSKQLMEAGLEEMRRTIREKEPARPSTRLSTMLAAELTTAAKHRQSEPPKLVNLVRGDLDWIVMKALEKDRTRRYETANGLALDVLRHLKHEPVVARPPSTAYRLQKAVRRNRLVFASAVVIAMALLVGMSVATVAWRQARIERDKAVKARLGESAERIKAEANAREARLAQARESTERSLSQQNLYASLVREARATRGARRIGYRDVVFKLLQQARALDVPQKDLSELRKEAVACLGDFVGLTPITCTNFLADQGLWWVLLHPTRPIVAFGYKNGTILLRDLPSGREVARLIGEHPLKDLCFAPKEDLLISVHTPRALSAQEDPSRSIVVEWGRAEDGSWSEFKKLAVPGSRRCLATTKGLYVAVADIATHSIQLLDLDSRSIVHRFSIPEEMRTGPEIALSPDGRFLAAETLEPGHPNTSLVDIWDLASGQRAQQLDPGLSRCLGLTFSTDGKYFAFISSAGATVYAGDGFKFATRLVDNFAYGLDVSFAPGRTMVAISTVQRNRVRLWDWTGKEDLAQLDDGTRAIWHLFSANGKSLLNFGAGGGRLYNLDATSEKLDLGGHEASVPGIAFSPDGSHLASVGKDRYLKVWESRTGRLEWQGGPLPGQGQSVSYSGDGKLLVTADLDTQLVWLWNTESHERLLELGSKVGQIWSAQLSPDGRHLVTASMPSRGNPGAVTIWEAGARTFGSSRTGDEVKLLKSIAGTIPCFALSPDGRRIAFVDLKVWGICLWEISGTQLPRLITNDFLNGNSQTLSFTPDGSHLLFINTNRALVTLEVATGSKVKSFPTCDPRRLLTETYGPKLSLSPDGTKLAILTISGLGVDLWDPKTGRLRYSLPDQNGTAFRLAWSPDSQRLAVSRSTGHIAIWSLSEVERVLAELGLNP